MPKSSSSGSRAKSSSRVKLSDHCLPNELKRRPIHEEKQKSPQSAEPVYDESKEKVEQDVDNHRLYPKLDELQDMHSPMSKPLIETIKTDSKTKQLYPDIEQSDTSNGNECRIYTQKNIYAYIGTFLLILALVIAAIFSLFSIKSSGSNIKSTIIDVPQLMSDLRTQFNSQPTITFRIINSALKRVSDKNSEPSAPAIITILANREAEDIAQKFAVHIAKAIAPEKYVIIEEDTYIGRKPSKMKLEIDEKIKFAAQNDSYKVIVVDRFQEMPFEAAMIFHNYCDHENARYKRAVYIFLLSVDDNIPENATTKYVDAVAMGRMRTMWHDAHRDKIDSLITRLTVSVVYVKKGM